VELTWQAAAGMWAIAIAAGFAVGAVIAAVTFLYGGRSDD
jgi:hypothetical protein